MRLARMRWRLRLVRFLPVGGVTQTQQVAATRQTQPTSLMTNRQ
jgi:hypothetical protein